MLIIIKDLNKDCGNKRLIYSLEHLKRLKFNILRKISSIVIDDSGYKVIEVQKLDDITAIPMANISK